MISSRNNYGTNLSEREVAGNCLILNSSGTSSSSLLSSSTDSERVNIEDGWLINANLLFVGPKIGEGAYSKVYEGKYVFLSFPSYVFENLAIIQVLNMHSSFLYKNIILVQVLNA